MVARRHQRHVRPDGLDHAGALVAEDTVRVPGRIGSRRRVEIGVADPARVQTDERLAGPRLRELDLLDGQRLPELLQDGGPYAHRMILIRPAG